MVTVIFDDDSQLTKPESVTMSMEEAMKHMRTLRITRITEVATPDLESDIGCYALVVKYDSFLVGATLTIIS